MNFLARKLFLIPFLLLALGLQAQTLFTIDGSPVSKEDFLKAYSKNNTGEKPTEKSYRDYLELYIRYKLKVRAAYDQQLDSLPAQRAELQNFRTQVADTYLKDETSLDRLVQEAFVRGQKDLHVAHIFIAFARKDNPDTAAAYEKAMAAWNTLRKGKKFNEVAAQFSDDPSAKSNGGDLGFITAFTLPYELENLAYSIPAGQFSRPYRSRAGYHIFKILSERKAIGRLKASQILLAFPPGADAAAKQTIHQRADSVYGALRKGADFVKLARQYSGDNLTYQSGGEMAEFGVGRYDSAFETAAFGLAKNGDISAPVPSSFGYHIIRRNDRIPYPGQMTTEVQTAVKAQVQADPRIETSRKALFARIYRQIDLQRRDVPQPDLWIFSDSAMLNAGLNSFHELNTGTVLISLPRQQFTIKDWLEWLRKVRPGGRAAGRSDAQLYEQFVSKCALEYYRDHLEDFNKDFAFQLTEFKEGNLLFEIMQRKIWDKASTDSAGLHHYYEDHKDRYWWEASADAILVTCNNEQTAQNIRGQLSGYPGNWRNLGDSAALNIQLDSGRYELSQIPALEKSSLNPGLTPNEVNKNDNTVSFAYILQLYPNKTPRNYHDARGFVINDYQTSLEDQWVASLKKKYPVKVDEAVLGTLTKNAP